MRLIFLTAALAAVAGSASAQAHRYPGLVNPTIGDIHRYENERLRQGAAERDALARQQSLNTRLTVLELQAARQPPLVEPPAYRPLRSIAEERRRADGAAVRRQDTVQGVTQIDAWLDRAPQ